MQDPSPVAEYLDALSREIGFDPALSYRVRMEVEDHLREATASAPFANQIEAQCYAIARFGASRDIALQYAAASLLAQTRRVGIVALLALIGIYLAMKGRGAWYGLVQWGASAPLKEEITRWVTIDVNAFRIALAIGLVGLGYIGSRRFPNSLRQVYCRQVNRCALLCTATAGALFVSVLSDLVITGCRLVEAGLVGPALIPLLSIAVELALMILLGLNIRTTIRRTAFASTLSER
jgi:hypothetical protein